MNRLNSAVARCASIAAFGVLLSACATPPPACMSPQSQNLQYALNDVQYNLRAGCVAHYDRYYDDLLTIAEFKRLIAVCGRKAANPKR